jgi:hypothetical protein
MARVDTAHRLDSSRGRKTGGAASFRLGAAAVLTVAALFGCRTTAPIESLGAMRARMNTSVASGFDLYDGGEYILAARRFHAAADLAIVLDDDASRRRATAGECVSWLRARMLAELADCGRRLEELQSQQRRPDPGVNTLIALGSIAGGHPLPALRLPVAVAPLIRASAEEGR